MSSIMEAAQSFIAKLNQPAAYHSVWVKTEVDPDTKEFTRSICLSIRKQYTSKFKNIPTEHEGYPVTIVPWPAGN